MDEPCVYIVGNDPYYHWLRVFLQSFREYNPHTKLRFIPWDDNTRRCERLASRYDFEVVTDPYFEQLDELGREFIPWPAGGQRAMRRLWAFHGPHRNFLYLDIDIVVTANYDAAFKAFAASPYDLVYFDKDLDQVYTPGPFQDAMRADYGSPGFNTGNWFARAGAFTKGDWAVLAQAALPVAHAFVPRKLEQPVFNYFCDVKRLKMAHLSAIAPDASTLAWAAQRIAFDPATRDYSVAEGDPPAPRKLYSVHFAGLNRVGPRTPNRELFVKYRTEGLPTAEQLALLAAWRCRTSRLAARLQLIRGYYWPRLKQRVRALFSPPQA